MTSDEYLENEYYLEKLQDEVDNPERDPDLETEEREERKRIAMEMDGPHEEGP